MATEITLLYLQQDQPDRDNTELKKEREPSVSSHL